MEAPTHPEKRGVRPADVYLLLAAETFLFTFGRGAFGPYVSPVLLYLCSLGACAGAYRLTRHRRWPLPPPMAVRPPQAARRWAWAVAIGLGLWLCVPQYAKVIHTTLAQDYSDIIMSITVYAQRFLAGETVYRPLTAELGYITQPTYFPAMWFPYVLPEWLHFDYRWVSGAVFAAAIGLYLSFVYGQQQSARRTFVLALLPFALLFAVVATEIGIVGWTVELMIAGYYLLLVASILRPSYWGQAVMLTLCLLSRFSLVFWVPLHLGLLFFQGARRMALGIAGTVVLGIGLLYVLPFLSHDWGLFMRVQHHYAIAALEEWGQLNGEGHPMHLYNGVGLGHFFYRYGHGTMAARLHALQLTHLTLLLLTMAGAVWLYWRQLAPRTDHRVYSVLVLKAYLTTFYAFVQVPYVYLASVGLFLSLYLALIVTRFEGAPTDREVLAGAGRGA